MMQEVDTEAELVSALADGQLQGAEFARTVDWLGDDERARLRWHAYHLVGDVLRMGSAASAGRDADFLQTLRLRLQQQAPLPPLQNTIDLIAVHDRSTRTTGQMDARAVSSNQPRFGSRWALGVASLAVTALVAWQLLGARVGPSEVPQLAQTLPSAPVVQQLAVGEASQPMIRDPQLDALLAAHRQFGGTSALQGSAGFLRNATFDGSSR